VEGKAPYSKVDYRRQSIVAELYGRFADAMEQYRTKNLGFTQDTKGLRNMIKELFGESSGDVDAAAFSKMWTETAEAARLRYKWPAAISRIGRTGACLMRMMPNELPQ
jgi:hypothetical protein